MKSCTQRHEKRKETFIESDKYKKESVRQTALLNDIIGEHGKKGRGKSVLTMSFVLLERKKIKRSQKIQR